MLEIDIHENSSIIQNNTGFNINHTNFISSTSGANALQVNNEDIKETENDLLTSMVDENMAVERPITSEAGNDENSLEEKLIHIHFRSLEYFFL